MKEDRKNIRRIVIAINEIYGGYDVIAKDIGIKGNMIWLLYALNDGEFHSQKQICTQWQFPRTTINTLTKECESLGFVTLKSIPGKKRELQVCLTENGRAYAHNALDRIYRAEEEALKETIKKCSPSFISDLENFNENLKIAFQNNIKHRKE